MSIGDRVAQLVIMAVLEVLWLVLMAGSVNPIAFAVLAALGAFWLGYSLFVIIRHWRALKVLDKAVVELRKLAGRSS